MSKSQYYTKRVDDIRTLGFEKDTAINAYNGALKDLAEKIANRLKDKFRDENYNRLNGMLNGVKYRIIEIRPYYSDYDATVGVDIWVERIDNYTPTDAEKKRLAKRPKKDDAAHLLFWLDKDVMLWEWGDLKNNIFRKLEYRFPLNNDGIEAEIERLNLSIKPIMGSYYKKSR